MAKALPLILLITLSLFPGELVSPASATNFRRCGPWKSVLYFQIGKEEVEVLVELADPDECSSTFVKPVVTPKSMKVKWRGVWHEIEDYCVREMRLDLQSVFVWRPGRRLGLHIGPHPDRNGVNTGEEIYLYISDGEVTCHVSD